MQDLPGYSFSVADRLMRYVQVDTQSDPHSAATPSTEKQKNLGVMLVDELKTLFAEKLAKTGSLDAAMTKAVWVAYTRGFADGIESTTLKEALRLDDGRHS